MENYKIPAAIDQNVSQRFEILFTIREEFFLCVLEAKDVAEKYL